MTPIGARGGDGAEPSAPNGITTMTKLTDTQLIVLSAASQREDHLLIPSENLKGAAARNLATKLLALGLAEEVPVGRDQPAWRSDEEQLIGLKITPAGLAAIGVEPEADGSGAEEPSSSDAQEGAPADASLGSPRAGSKQALVVSLLERESGATIGDLVGATGWLPHTTRAALTGLRRKGYALGKSKRADGATVYRIATDTAAEAA